MRYRLTNMSGGLWEFSAATDGEAVELSEEKTQEPEKLEEIRGVFYYHVVRVVKEW